MRTFLSLALVFAPVVLAQAPPVVAIRNAKIVTVSGPVLAKGTVIIRNGLIADVGENIQVPPEAWVVDAEGLTAYPGLIEAMGSLGIPEPGSTPRPAGAPPQMPGAAPQAAPPARGPADRPLTNSWVRAADLVRINERRIEAARSHGYTTSVSFPATGIFTGQGAVVDLAGENSGQMIVDQRAGQLITLSRNGFTAFPGSLMGTIAYIRQVFLDADQYKKAKELYTAKPQGLERPVYDRALEGVLESPRILLPANNVVEINRMIRFSKELNRPTILYGVNEGYKAPDLLAKAGLPVLVNLKWPEALRDQDPDEIESMRVLELRENAPSTPAALAKANVKFAFYSSGVENPIRNARKAILSGLTPDQAIRAMTLSVAEIYGVADRIGSIEKGKIANLVLTRGDLFVDRPQIQAVFVDGIRYEPPPPPAPAKQEATQ